MKNIEFKQRETKAAFMVINAMKEQLKEREGVNNLHQKEIDKNDFPNPEMKEQQEMFLTSHWIEAELLKQNIEKLQNDIEQQSFDF